MSNSANKTTAKTTVSKSSGVSGAGQSASSSSSSRPTLPTKLASTQMWPIFGGKPNAKKVVNEGGNLEFEEEEECLYMSTRPAPVRPSTPFDRAPSRTKRPAVGRSVGNAIPPRPKSRQAADRPKLPAMVVLLTSSDEEDTAGPSAAPGPSTSVETVLQPTKKDRPLAVGKACEICGDSALCVFQGKVRSCASCWKFFADFPTRSKKPVCEHDGKCKITKETRAKCAACRLAKGKAAGIIVDALGSRRDAGALCVICGDTAKGKYQGKTLSCLPCQCFFKYTASLPEKPVCKRDGNCQITQETRIECAACRLAKCTAAGMSADALTPRQIAGKVCAICGDMAKFLFQGRVLACAPCQNFFTDAATRRKKPDPCAYGGHCAITKEMGRKKCGACRLAKCFAAGMRVEDLSSRRDPLTGSAIIRDPVKRQASIARANKSDAQRMWRYRRDHPGIATECMPPPLKAHDPTAPVPQLVVEVVSGNVDNLDTDEVRAAQAQLRHDIAFVGESGGSGKRRSYAYMLVDGRRFGDLKGPIDPIDLVSATFYVGSGMEDRGLQHGRGLGAAMLTSKMGELVNENKCAKIKEIWDDDNGRVLILASSDFVEEEVSRELEGAMMIALNGGRLTNEKQGHVGKTPRPWPFRELYGALAVRSIVDNFCERGPSAWFGEDEVRPLAFGEELKKRAERTKWRVVERAQLPDEDDDEEGVARYDFRLADNTDAADEGAPEDSKDEGVAKDAGNSDD